MAVFGQDDGVESCDWESITCKNFKIFTSWPFIEKKKLLIPGLDENKHKCCKSPFPMDSST